MPLFTLKQHVIFDDLLRPVTNRYELVPSVRCDENKKSEHFAYLCVFCSSIVRNCVKVTREAFDV